MGVGLLRRVPVVVVAVSLVSLLVVAVPRAAGDAPSDPDVALFNPATGEWHIRYRHGHTVSFYYGNPGDTPLMGDWDCDGTDTVAMYRESTGFIYYRNQNTFGTADNEFYFGIPGDIPIAGDWDGDGCDSFGVYRNGTVFLSNRLQTTAADSVFYFGVPGDRPFAGDFDGDGIDSIGLYRQSSGFAYLTNAIPDMNAVAPTHASFYYGIPGDRILAGDWDGDGDDSVGIFRPGDQRFYLSFENAAGMADLVIDWGQSVWLPATGTLAGPWEGASCSLFSPSPAGDDLNEGPTDYSWSLRPTGDIRAVILFVDFDDAPASESTQELYDLVVSDNRAYFSELSYGLMDLIVDPVDRWYRLPQPSSAYGLADDVTFDEQLALTRDAVAAADPAVDFRSYDLVYVVTSTGSSVPGATAINAPVGTGILADGVEVRFSATLGEMIRDEPTGYGAETLAHETAHMLGLPDLYLLEEPDYWTSVGMVGGWDLMSYARGHLLAWHKLKLGWLDMSHIVCITTPSQMTVQLTPIEVPSGRKAIVIKVDESTAYVAEVRRAVGQDDWLCDEGLLVYHVDAAIGSGEGPIRVKRAQGGDDPWLTYSCGPGYAAPFDLGPGETSAFADPGAGVRFQIQKVEGDVYTVRVTVD